MASGGDDEVGRVVVVWDGAIRVFHWLLAGLLAFSWYSAEAGLMDWHRRSGYAVAGLLSFRIIWGFVGTRTARFATFVRGPKAVARYVGSLGKREPSPHVGHSPLGALSVLALLSVSALQVVSGLFAVDIDGIESGPLSDRVSFDQGRWFAEIHHSTFTALQVLVLLHIAAILFYLIYQRDNLIGAMITGKRRAAGAGVTRAPLLRLFLTCIAAGFLAWLLSQGLRLSG